MNLTAYLSGVVRALGGDSDWEGYFNLSKTGLKQSLFALAMTTLFYYICALGVQTQRAFMNGSDAPFAVPFAAFWIILILYVLTFIGCVYILTQVFDKQDRFRAWVIVRHWSVFFMSFIAAFLFGLFLMGVLPFSVANMVAFGLYLATLLVDIRLAQKIGGFDWGAAILCGCVIHAMGLTFILAGIMQFAS